MIRSGSTEPIPRSEVLRAVEAYSRQRAAEENHGSLTKRQALRALARLNNACNEVLRALDGLPDDMQTFYSGPLRAGAIEVGHEARWRRSQLSAGRGKIRLAARRFEARSRFESTIAFLFERHGGRITTYDPRRYVEPRGGQGARGGRLALVLIEAYQLANITAPADLSPTLARLAREGRARTKQRREAAARAAADRRKDPREILRALT